MKSKCNTCDKEHNKKDIIKKKMSIIKKRHNYVEPKIKMNLEIVTHDLIYKVISKKRHIIFIHDVNEELTKLHLSDTLKDLYVQIFPFIHKAIGLSELDDFRDGKSFFASCNIYMLQFKTFKAAKDYFYENYINEENHRFDLIKKGFYMCLYSNSKFIEENC